jgi:RNA polymerase sigma-70 factor (ECF subfamily)
LPRNADARARLSAEDPRTDPATSQTQGDPAEEAIDARCATLVRRAQGGDERAIERLWELNEADLHVHLSRYLGDPRDVAEAAQDVFIRMHAALPDYEVGGIPFRFWLQRIARNHAIDLLRREGRTHVEEEDRIVSLLEAAGGASPTAGEGWLEDERTATAVSSLSVEQQRMLLLRFGFGLKSDEVAEVLGCSPAAVRKQQSRALHRLAEVLETA